MDAFTVHTGRAVPLRRTNVDTDQIVPAVYLKRVTRTGFADALFASWRSQPGFVLDDPAHIGATVLVAGRDFGTGSSREHAVWALQEWGFRVVISSRFADIFRGNAIKTGLLPVQLDDTDVKRMMAAVEADASTEVRVDLVSRTVSWGSETVAFAFDDHARHRLLEGLDDIATTLQQDRAISDFETRRPSFLPIALPIRG